MPAPQIIRDLVDKFDRNFETYKKATNETQVRREFIDTFFSELGWDMDNTKTKAIPQSRTQLERQIAHADSEIDRLVYELYGLSEEEVSIIERK